MGRGERGDSVDMVGEAECGRSWQGSGRRRRLGKGEERGGRSEEALCEIGSGSGLGFGTGDLVLFGARVWD
jgi:hypothetical protein